jgi:hypothetical protein
MNIQAVPKMEHSQLTTLSRMFKCTVGGQIKLGHSKFNLCKSDH